jgi:hypothetical protein
MGRVETEMFDWLKIKLYLYLSVPFALVAAAYFCYIDGFYNGAWFFGCAAVIVAALYAWLLTNFNVQ